MNPPLRSFCALICLFTVHLMFGQIKIGNNPQNINQSSLLELESNTRTLVISRLSTSKMLQIAPLNGAIVYNTDENCVFFYDGLSWKNLCKPNLDTVPPEEPNPVEPTEPESIIQLQITDNKDGTYVVDSSEIEPFIIDTRVHLGLPGALFYANSNGEPTTETSNLFWDDINKNFGIGTSDPKNTLDVNGILKVTRIHNGRGSPSYPGYHFQDNVTTGMFSILRNELGFSTGGKEVMRLSGNGYVGIQVQNPLATLHVGGDLRVDGSIITSNGALKTTSSHATKAIRRLSSPKEALTINDETIVLEESVSQLVFPNANNENTGVVFILKNLGNKIIQLNLPYRNLENRNTNYLAKCSVTWVQSDGVDWQQIR